MNVFLSHFQITPKNVVACLVAFAAYVQNLGHLPETPRQWGVVVTGFLLSALIPARNSVASDVSKERSLSLSEGGKE